MGRASKFPGVSSTVPRGGCRPPRGAVCRANQDTHDDDDGGGDDDDKDGDDDGDDNDGGDVDDENDGGDDDYDDDRSLIIFTQSMNHMS